MKFAALLLCLALGAGLGATEKEPAEATNPVLKLEPFMIHGKAQSNFAVSIRIYVNKETKKIRIIITRVMPDSDASAEGLKAGDEIVKINGLPVADMNPDIGPDSELGKLLINRLPGVPLDLDIVTVRTRQVTLHARQGVDLP